MTDQQISYRAGELSTIYDEKEIMRIKIKGRNGETKWLNITPEEFMEVYAVLTRDT